MQDLADEYLMERVRLGEIKCLGTLFERYHIALFNFFLRLGCPKDVAEDLVHDVFLRLLKYRHTYQSHQKFTAWFYQIARRVWASHFSRLQRVSLSPVNLEKIIDPHRSPDEQLEQKQDMILLKRALKSLSFEKREALILSRFQGLKYAEIAAIQACSITAVKTRIRRALLELKEQFIALTGEN